MPLTKVWLVCWYEDVHGAFSTKEKAEEYCTIKGLHPYKDVFIDEITLDEEVT